MPALALRKSRGKLVGGSGEESAGAAVVGDSLGGEPADAIALNAGGLYLACCSLSSCWISLALTKCNFRIRTTH